MTAVYERDVEREASRVQACRLDSVRPERVSWIWPGRLPRGKVVVLDGDPGVGKSNITIDLTARISTGSPMPDGHMPEHPENVVLLSAEDGLADTIVPRLLAAGGDAARVHAVTEIKDFDEDGRLTSRPPALPDDIERLGELVAEVEAGIVIIDVLNAYLSGRVNNHRDQDIRRALHPLAALAERTKATVLMLRHLNKNGDGNALYRGGGSIGIIGAARAGLLVAKDPDDPAGERRVLAVSKSNLAAIPPALIYALVPDDLYGCSRIEWRGQSAHTASQLLAVRSDGPDGQDDDHDTGDAKSALEQILEEGAMFAKLAIDAMAAAGFSKDQAKRAKAKLQVKSIKVGKPGDKEQGWKWVLPRRAQEQPEESEEGKPSDAALFASLALSSGGDEQ